jgi:putative sterol carrier protein
LPDFFINDQYTFTPPGAKAASKASANLKSSEHVSQTLSIPGFKASDVFQSMATFLLSKSRTERQSYVAKTKAVFEFDIKNSAGKVQTWILDLKNGEGSIHLGKGERPDIVISMNDNDFIELSAGKINGQKAFFAGKLKIKGNVMLATKLEVLLKTFKSSPKL